MSKTQKFSESIKSDLSFFILILIMIIGLFMILSPKVSSQLFPFKRQAILNEFITDTRQKGSIDPQGYWKFREFYSPGYFTFSKNGLEKTLISQAKEKIGIKYHEENIDLTFSVFSSILIDSLDMLTTQTDLDKVIDQNKLPKENIIFMNKNSLIYKETPKIIKIVFLLSNSEMKRANGFFYYTDQDKELVRNKNWFNITIVKE